MISKLTIYRENELKETLYEVAKRLGKSVSYLSNVETGKKRVIDEDDRMQLVAAYKSSRSLMGEMLGWRGKSENEKYGVRELQRVSRMGNAHKSTRSGVEVRKEARRHIQD